VYDNNSPSIADGTETITINSISGQRVGMLFRYNGTNAYAGIYYDNGNWGWLNGATGGYGNLFCLALAINTYHAVTIAYSGTNVTISVDGVQKYSGSVSGWYTQAGKLAVRTWYTSNHSHFDNVNLAWYGSSTPTPTNTPTPTATPPNTGWVSPAANAAATGGDGNGFQTSPANAYSDNAAFAVDTNSGTNTSTSCSDSGKDRHVFYSYNLSSVPGGSTIVGIEVQLQMKVDSTSGSPKSCIELSWNGGTNWTAAKTSSTFTKSEASYTLGSSSDTWGHTWTVAELSNLRVRITNVSSNTNRDFSLDWIPVKVYYQ